ncbi:hypothetical protein GW796_00605 [archaeon]|nr:hypothetical protein [archaeon]NCQ50405.1 hypothetical protein [archaeon]
MTKQEFLQLFELEGIYNKYQNKIPFCFSLHDRLVGTDSAIYFSFKDNNTIKIHMECVEFNVKIQHLEISIILDDNKIGLNKKELFKNEIFPFLTFDSNLEAALKFIADFLNKILKPKYQLMGGVSTY